MFEEEKVEDTGTFWLFIGGGALGVILIGILIFCLIRMKKRNDLIVAKVEKLSAAQLQEKDYIPEEERNDDFYAS